MTDSEVYRELLALFQWQKEKTSDKEETVKGDFRTSFYKIF